MSKAAAAADPPLPGRSCQAWAAEMVKRFQDGRMETLDQLRADALGLLAEAALGKGLGCRERGEPYQVVLHVDAGLLAGTEEEGRCELEGGPGVALMEQNRACGIQITPETNHVGWGGEPLDLVWAVEGILQEESSHQG